MKSPAALATVLLLTATSAIAQSEPVRISNMAAVPGPTVATSQIVGPATNITNRSISYVFVNFNLYDANNALVGNCVAAAQNLGPGESWNFSASTLVPYDHFTVSKIDTSY